MMRFLFLSAFFLSACTSSDTAFCDCLEAGEALNEQTQVFMDSIPTAEDAATIEELKAIKEKQCADYETMSGDKMLELKKACTP